MIRVAPSWLPNGSREYRDFDGRLVAVTTPRFEYGSTIDYRSPPFEQTSPCIYCGAFDDRGHDASLHVNRALGALAAERRGGGW